MTKLKFAALVVAVVLIAGASISGQAQKRSKALIRIEPPIPVGVVLSGTYASRIDATQLSVGEANYAASQVYGWTCYGQTKGDLSGYVFMSMNYSLPAFTPVDPAGSPSAFQPPPTSDVTGGSWSQLIFVDGVYTGSVSGRIVGGVLRWDSYSNNATVELKLVADDGTDAYLGSSGNGDFQGLLDRSAKSVPTITGTLTLNY
jgi:hypothetical protein